VHTGDRQEGAHFQGLDLLGVEHACREVLEFAGKLLGGAAQVGGRAYVARQVAQLAAKLHAVGDGAARRQPLLGLRGLASLYVDGDFLELGLAVAVTLAQSFVVAIKGLARRNGACLGAPAQGGAGALDGGQGGDALGKPRLDAVIGEGLLGARMGLGAVGLLFAQAD